MNPKEFQPKLIKWCAAAGVAVVFVPELPKTGISGATRWLGEKATQTAEGQRVGLVSQGQAYDFVWFHSRV